MERRQFLAASLATSALAVAGNVAAETPAPRTREFYHLRRYTLQSGPQTKLTESYFGDALIPALTRMGMGPMGAFRLDIGPETPDYYLLIPGASVETLAELDMRLAQDADFLKAADPFWNATAAAPAFQRVESFLLAAFEGWPKLTPPASSAAKAKRIFEIFTQAGCHPVFFGDTLIGARMPSLTYMLSFADAAELDARWDVFRNDPAWKKLSTSPRYSSDQLVTNITNLVLSPLACSQI